YNPADCMGITIGQKLGAYEITGLLGKGGMGEVYRARDLKLKREVAIKLLPEELSRDADRVSRFQREAEVLASLNHPNIAGIYDLQQINDSRYLVLELVEGETLADRVQRGPLLVEEAVEIAKHICEALEAAHEKGIVHRDLKPANIKITPEGRVKVLDFGLAKIFPAEGSENALLNAPTLTSAVTGRGALLGTAAYMSPEQARGRDATNQSDIWAFGCVLFEMLSGPSAFYADTASDTISKILRDEPDWSKIDVPASVRRVMERCLQKDQRRRFRNI